jgi:hypothetical protein
VVLATITFNSIDAMQMKYSLFCIELLKRRGKRNLLFKDWKDIIIWAFKKKLRFNIFAYALLSKNKNLPTLP